MHSRVVAPSFVASSTVTCLFCSSSFPPGAKGEDIIPRWYATAIGHPVTSEVLFGLADSTASVFSEPTASQTVAAKQFRVPDVCPACNNGWMSQIEQHAKPHLLQMMGGSAIDLAPSAQREVAEWAQLKAILWDHLETPQRLPATYATAFFTTRPLRHMSVVLGGVESESSMDIAIARHVGMLRLGGSGGGDEILRVTIRFDHLLLQVGTALRSAVPVELLREASGPFVGIWPPRLGQESDAVHWPPPAAVSPTELGALL